MAIGRLIAKSLLVGEEVGVKGFGTFFNEAPSAQQHVHEKHRIWTSPRTSMAFREDPSTGFEINSSDAATRLLSDLLRSEEGLQEPEAERMSAAWAADVRRELADSGISVLRGLGTFTQNEQGIQFSQDDDFPSATEMPAIEGYSAELAQEQSHSGDEPPEMAHQDRPAEHDEPAEPDASDGPTDTADLADSGDIADSGDAAYAGEGTPTDQDPASDELAPVAAENSAEHTAENVAGEDAPADSTDELTEEPAPVTDTEAHSEEDDSESESPEPLPVVPPPARSRSPRRYERDQGGSSKAAVWVLGALALIVVVALVYRFVLTPSPNQPAMAEQQAEIEPAIDDSSAISEADSSLIASGALQNDGSGNAIAHGSDERASSSDETTSGGPTSVNDNESTPVHEDELVRGMGGYTLVVGSTMNETTARKALAQFERLGLPMGVLAYDSDDETRYRIAIGHYQTAALADTARTTRADELPEGTWVLAVR